MLAALLTLSLFAQQSPSREPLLAIEHVTVIPMDRERVVEDATVIVRGDRIEAVGREVEVPASAQRVDGRGKWLIPGLADMHCHFLSDERIAEEFVADELDVILANGVTAIRNPIGTPLHLALRAEIRRGERVAPDLWVASPQLAGRAFPGVFLGRAVTTPDEARAAVRDFRGAGYDFIKVTFFVARPVYDAIVDEAARQGIRVIGHVGPQVPLARAIEAGQQIEHLDEFFEALVPADAPFQGSVSSTEVWSKRHWESLDWLDASKIDGLARSVAAAGVWNTPTLTFLNTSFGTGRSDEEIRASPDWRFVSESVRDELLANRAHFWKDPPSEARRARYVELRNRITVALHAAGAKLMCGSDSPEWLLLYGFTLHRELESLVAAGLSPYAALETATRNPHEWLGDLGEVGTIEPGRRADLVLLRANPLERIGSTREIEAVVVRGRLLDRAALDARLEAARVRLASAPLLAH